MNLQNVAGNLFLFLFLFYQFFVLTIDSLFFRLDSNQLSVTRHKTIHQKNDGILIPPSIHIAPSGKRKRRLSDAGYDGTPKRPHNALAVPRLQTVSDPFPLANPIISELYKTPFDQTISDSFPSPVSVESLDDTQVEVDFYNYHTSPDIIQSLLFPDSLDHFPGKFFSFYMTTILTHALALPSLLSTAISEPLSHDKSQLSDPNLQFQFESYLKDLDTPPANLPSEAGMFLNLLPTQADDGT